MTGAPHLLDLEFEELAAALAERGFDADNTAALHKSIYAGSGKDIENLRGLPRGFVKKLDKHFRLDYPEIIDRTDGDGAVRFAVAFDDGAAVESVYIRGRRSDSVCLSTQAGCGLGCAFCATAQMGFIRNLETREITGQLMAVLKDTDHRRPLNVIFMGMGEPLLNYENVMKAFRIMSHPKGPDISHKRITLSTAGIIPGLEKLAEETTRPNLAYSLNAVTPEIRTRLMPVERKYPMEKVLGCLKALPLKTSKRPILEYVVIKDVNDTDDEARVLGGIAKELRTKVNLLAFNPHAGTGLKRPGEKSMARFREITASRGVTVTIRKSRGRRINAACGQLGVKQGAKGPGTNPHFSHSCN